MAKPWKWTSEYIRQLASTLFPDEDPDTPQARKKARILRAATELFIRQGYKKTSVDEIARRAEVAKGTVYLYFDTKASLLMHAIKVEKEVLYDRFGPVFDKRVDGEDRLRTYLKVLLTAAQDLPLVAAMLRRDREMMAAMDEWDPELLAQGEEIGLDWLSDLLEAAAPDELSREERRDRAEVLLGLRYFTGLLLDERVRHGRDLDGFADTMVDVLMHGLLQAPPRTVEESLEAEDEA
jgi:AcrR family transcriptional regulator